LIFFVIFGLGNAGDYLQNHKGHKFSTRDQDNDVSGAHCAAVEAIKGAWWFYDCRESSLNGVYWNEAENGTINWGADIQPIKRAEIKIRPLDF